MEINICVQIINSLSTMRCRFLSFHSRVEYPVPLHFLHRTRPAPRQTLQSCRPFSVDILPSLQKTHIVPPFPAHLSQGTGSPFSPKTRDADAAMKAPTNKMNDWKSGDPAGSIGPALAMCKSLREAGRWYMFLRRPTAFGRAT